MVSNETIVIERLVEIALKNGDISLSDDNKVTINQLQSVSLDTLYKYGCRNWDDSGLLLITPSILKIIKNNEWLDCIDGNQELIGRDDIDTDTRGGCIAFGFIHPILKEQSKVK